MREKVDKAATFDGKEFVRTLTTSPGVYLMLDASGEPLYVGKAGSLKKRVGSYFLKPRMEPRIAAMVAQIARIDVTLTRTEVEAPLLEAHDQERSRATTSCCATTKAIHIFFSPRQKTIRAWLSGRGAQQQQGEYFAVPERLRYAKSLNLMQLSGAPVRGQLFPQSFAAVSAISDQALQRAMRGSDCSDGIRRQRAPCRDVSTGKSSAVIDELGAIMEHSSAALEFEKAARVRDQIAMLKRLQAQNYVQGASADLDVLACSIEGGLACVSVLYFRNGVSLGSRDFFPRLPTEATTGVVLASFIAQYYLDKPVPRELILSDAPDDVAVLADMLTTKAGYAIELKTKVRADRARFVDLARKNSQAALAARLASNQTMHERFEALRDLLDLGETPRRLECFDISHTMGEATVASCVVYGPEGAEKSNYRRFNIAGIEPGDDYAAMRQALERRYKRLQAGEAALPDILLIDGGKGQVTQALEVLADLAVSGVLVVGVAKGAERRAGHETLIRGDNGKTLWPGPESLALHLIQSVRDEAHRFATGHRQRREKAWARKAGSRKSPQWREAPHGTAQTFRRHQRCRVRGPEELAKVKGVSRELAATIYAAFHG